MMTNINKRKGEEEEEDVGAVARNEEEERRGSRDESVSAGLGLMKQKSTSEPQLQTTAPNITISMNGADRRGPKRQTIGGEGEMDARARGGSQMGKEAGV